MPPCPPPHFRRLWTKSSECCEGAGGQHQRHRRLTGVTKDGGETPSTPTPVRSPPIRFNLACLVYSVIRFRVTQTVQNLQNFMALRICTIDRIFQRNTFLVKTHPHHFWRLIVLFSTMHVRFEEQPQHQQFSWPVCGRWYKKVVICHTPLTSGEQTTFTLTCQVVVARRCSLYDLPLGNYRPL